VENNEKPFRVLTLDGGGSKGFYTLGVLHELEAMTGSRLCERFDLIYGTSTGSIIGALLALGYPVHEIHQLYKKHVPAIMGQTFPAGKSAALKTLADEVFGKHTFSDMKIRVGIVATRWLTELADDLQERLVAGFRAQGDFRARIRCSPWRRSTGVMLRLPVLQAQDRYDRRRRTDRTFRRWFLRQQPYFVCQSRRGEVNGK
jgi:predicted acylesterase/phospholipase RssA